MFHCLSLYVSVQNGAKNSKADLFYSLNIRCLRLQQIDLGNSRYWKRSFSSWGSIMTLNSFLGSKAHNIFSICFFGDVLNYLKRKENPLCIK